MSECVRRRAREQLLLIVFIGVEKLVKWGRTQTFSRPRKRERTANDSAGSTMPEREVTLASNTKCVGGDLRFHVTSITARYESIVTRRRHQLQGADVAEPIFSHLQRVKNF
jgi:hypothetical protein